MKSIGLTFVVILCISIKTMFATNAGDTLADFSFYKRNDNVVIHRSDFYGQITVIMFIWDKCDACKKKIPTFEEQVALPLYNRGYKNANSLPVSVYYVSYRESDSAVINDALAGRHYTDVLSDPALWTQGYDIIAPLSGFPQFVVINGIGGSANQGLWKLTYKSTGTSATVQGTSINLLDAVDAIQAPIDIWWDSVSLGDQWMWSSWFNYFWAGARPWVWKPEQGWLYTFGNLDSNVWMYSPEQGWFWVSRNYYPYVYSDAVHDYVKW